MKYTHDSDSVYEPQKMTPDGIADRLNWLHRNMEYYRHKAEAKEHEVIEATAEFAELEAHCAELEAARLKLMDKLDFACANIAELEAACKSLREKSDGYFAHGEAVGTVTPSAAPVQVRFDVTAEDFKKAWENPKEQRTWPDFAIGYLADHAIIDVPPGVPTPEELREIFHQAQGESFSLSAFDAGIAAIRAAVLAGVAGEKPLPPFHLPLGDMELPEPPEFMPPADLVEALTEVMWDTYWKEYCWDETQEALRDKWRTNARAAIAFLRPVTWQDVEKKWAEIRYNGVCEPSVQDYSALMNWLESVLPGEE